MRNQRSRAHTSSIDFLYGLKQIYKEEKKMEKNCGRYSEIKIMEYSIEIVELSQLIDYPLKYFSLRVIKKILTHENNIISRLIFIYLRRFFNTCNI